MSCSVLIVAIFSLVICFSSCSAVAPPTTTSSHNSSATTSLPWCSGCVNQAQGIMTAVSLSVFLVGLVVGLMLMIRGILKTRKFRREELFVHTEEQTGLGVMTTIDLNQIKEHKEAHINDTFFTIEG